MADTSLKALTSVVYRMAEVTSKNIQPDVKDIRDAVCGPSGILDALSSIDRSVNKLNKKDTVEKLTEKSTAKKNNKLLKSTDTITSILKKILGRVEKIQGGRGSGGVSIKDTDTRKKSKSLEGISKALDVMEKLRHIKMKDFIASKTKMKHIKNLMDKFRNMFKKFKSQKEMEGTISFANSSIEVVKKLSKIAILAIPAKIGAKAIETIFLGSSKNRRTGGLLAVFKKVANNADQIKIGAKSMKDLLKGCGSLLLTSIILVGIAATSVPAMIGTLALKGIIKLLIPTFRNAGRNIVSITKGKLAMTQILLGCGKMFLTSIILAGLAVVGIPAMLGALLMKGIVLLLVGTFKLLSKTSKQIIKGSAVLLIMSVSVITFALGLGLMSKAVRDMKWKDFGIMLASIAGLGAVMAVLGIPVVAGLVALGSVSLLIMGAALGIFALSLMAWQKLDAKAAMDNIRIAIGGLREVFGLELGKKAEDDKRSGLQRLKGGLIDIAMAVLDFGKSFFVMGQLLLAGAALGLLYHGLKNWAKFTDGPKAAKNIEVAVNALKRVFGLGDVKGNNNTKLKALGGGILDMGIALFQSGKALLQLGTITLATAMADIIRVTLIPWNKYDPKPAIKNMGEAISGLKEIFGLTNTKDGGTLSGLGGSLLDMGIALFQSAQSLVQVGTITIATAMSDLIRLALIPWNDYDPSKAIGNMSNAITTLKDLFGLTDNDGLSGTLSGFGGSILNMAMALLNSGGTLVKMGTIMLATAMLDKIRENLIPWEDYDSSKSITNISTAINGLLATFGLGSAAEEQTDSVVKNVVKMTKKVVKAGTDIVSSIADGVSSVATGGAALAKISILSKIVSVLDSIKTSISPWDNYDSTNALTNISTTVKGLLSHILIVQKLDDGNKTSGNFVKYAKNISKGLEHLKKGFTGAEILNDAVNPLDLTVKAVNKLDITKASTMIDLFKSFSKIGVKPFDKFTDAVHKFSDSCNDLIDAMNNFEPMGTGVVTTESENGESTTVSGGVNIANTHALATAIANAIKSLPVNVETNISDINLVVDGITGRSVTLRLDN